MTDSDVVAAVDQAFAAPKPARFFPNDGDPESDEHNALLSDRDRTTLLLSDVDNAGWDPVCACSAEGFAYYFPALARFTLCDPSYSYYWYADQLIYLISRNSGDNRFLLFCSRQQREAVAMLVQHLIETRHDLIASHSQPSDFESCLELWRSAEHEA